MRMDVKVLSIEGQNVGTVSALAAWDHRSVSPRLLHQVAVAALGNVRVSRAHTKDRSERRGGGRKPWRQKGTGRARHGSTRSPIWRKGGVAFGPRADRTYVSRVSSSMKKSALAGALIGKIRDRELFLLDSLPDVGGKTKALAAACARLPLRGATLFLVPGSPDQRAPFLQASRNLPGVRVAHPLTVSAADLLLHTTIVTTEEGLRVVERRVSKEA